MFLNMISIIVVDKLDALKLQKRQD